MDIGFNSMATAFFDTLKSSVLSKDNATPAELMVWLDMENMHSTRCIIQIFETLTANFRTRPDITSWFIPFGTLKYFSDTAFKNLFVLMFKTDMLDDVVLDPNFKAFAKKKMLKLRNNSDVLNGQLDLFEVYAELYERIEDKENKKDGDNEK